MAPSRATGFDSDGVKLSFGGPEAANLVGITYRQLDHWARKGLVLPSVVPASGSGSQRRYSYRDLVELKIIKSLRDAGLSLQKIERAFSYIREQLDEEPAGLRVFSDGNRVYASRSNEEIIDLLNSGQVVFGFALDPIRQELTGTIDELHPAAMGDVSPEVREMTT
ncbi:MAG: MerR family transcriptional regulator [Actinobacteria bacterium ATB1]|nr:MerR family transcriptional regulator [Actinobacteria bacterium ATB1]